MSLLLAAAVVHKARLLLENHPGEVSVIRALPWGKQHAGVLLVVAAAAELLGALSIWVLPAIGLGIATVLLFTYTTLLRRLPREAPCHCFGASSAATVRTALPRNVILTGLCGAAATIYFIDPDAEVQIPVAVAAALVTLSFVAGLEATERFARRTQLEGEPLGTR